MRILRRRQRVPSPVVISAVAFLVVGVLLVVAAPGALRRGRWIGAGARATLGALCLALAALAAVVSVAARGYRALTFETLAATVTTEPVGPQRFRATIALPERRIAMYELAGDAFYVDAHIVKWHPFANLLGLHTAYELDRVAGRYSAVADERTRPHTVFSLARPKHVDLFDLARRFAFLAPIVDAEYGSATFVGAARSATFEVRVSTTGLLIRPVSP